jgi:hypothetical protein
MKLPERPDVQATLTLRHRVHAAHATTGEPITAIAATVVPPLPVGWIVEVRSGDVLVSAWQHAPAPEDTPQVRLRVLDPRLRLDPPEVEIPLDRAEILHAFTAARSRLEVVLLTPDGDPSTGRTVEARGTSGSPAPLSEQGATGTYRSAERTWPARFHPLELAVDGTAVRRIALDLTRATTRVRVIDPT